MIFLSIIHGRLLWLREEIKIHVKDIQRLTCLSLAASDVMMTFQNISKRSNKARDQNYYENFFTKRGGKGSKIDLISLPNIKFSCYLIASKIMRRYTKGECPLDTIPFAEHCV